MARAKFIKPAIQDQPASFGDTTVNGVLSITGIENVSQSIADAGGGGTTPTLQQVTDQGSSTTTPITASIISASSFVSASSFSGEGIGLTKLKRPIETHTSNFTASDALEGSFNIVGGTLECMIPNDSSATIGAEWEFFQSSSTDNFTFVTQSTSVSLISKDSNTKLSGLGSAATLKRITTTTYYLIGDLTT